MAEENRSIFNKKATEKLRSPDDLDKYVRVTNPSVWIILAACIVLLAGLLVWGVFGTVSTNVKATSVYKNGNILCFLATDKASEVHIGDVANIDGERMKVSEIGDVPISREEAKTIVDSDYLVSALVDGDWTYVVYFAGDKDYKFHENVPLPTTITTELIAPISLILGDND